MGLLMSRSWALRAKKSKGRDHFFCIFSRSVFFWLKTENKQTSQLLLANLSFVKHVCLTKRFVRQNGLFNSGESEIYMIWGQWSKCQGIILEGCFSGKSVYHPAPVTLFDNTLRTKQANFSPRHFVLQFKNRNTVG